MSQALVPVRLERIGDQPVVGIDFEVTSTRELGLIAGAFKLGTSQSFGGLDSPRDFFLHGERNLQCRGCHRIEQQCADGSIDFTSTDRLSGLVGSSHRCLFTHVIRQKDFSEGLISHAHAGTAATA